MKDFGLSRLEREFYIRDVLSVAPDLLGKKLVIAGHSGTPAVFRITETEAYRGTEDLACHASRGRTSRTEIMYHRGGMVYVYLIYGIYWMFNVVTSVEDRPQAVLVRGLEGYPGPGKLTRALGIDRRYYGADLVESPSIWIGDSGESPGYISTARIGIDYAGSPWAEKPWRYVISG